MSSGETDESHDLGFSDCADTHQLCTQMTSAASVDDEQFPASNHGTHGSCQYVIVKLAAGFYSHFIQCFDAVGWAAGRASGL